MNYLRKIKPFELITTIVDNATKKRKSSEEPNSKSENDNNRTEVLNTQEISSPNY